ncbi:hypothetical protein [Bradyrhizobium sp. CCBAU 21360]|uniref:hypothetical protein n=2 Tax=unclassified Bradyrhizobium TaxID=2631580 RepID=UPI002305EEB1|nr:hypothetical protein [Bradyrhizobium sp. CCBAU 21360]MDA9457677.1 hypothetical protein [Bradyrhizobium sp. CCBAU 21359]
MRWNESSGATRSERHRALSYWRKLPCEAFELEMQDEVLSCVAQMASTFDDLQRAIDGDATAAIDIALKLDTPGVITASVDLTMTVLLRSAFEDAGAAMALSTKLLQMPLPAVDRAKLAASWRLHNVYLTWRSRRSASRNRSRRRS